MATTIAMSVAHSCARAFTATRCHRSQPRPCATLGLRSASLRFRSGSASGTSELLGASAPAARRPSPACRQRITMSLPPSYKRWTAPLKAAVKKAQDEACRLGQNYVKPEHLLLGVLAESDGLPMEDKCIAARVLEQNGLTLARARARVQAMGGASGLGLIQQTTDLPLSGKADEALTAAKKRAVELGMPDAIDTEHLLMVLLAEEGGMVCRLLDKEGLEVAPLRQQVLEVALAETPARLPEPPRKATPGWVRGLALLSFLPLAAAAYYATFQAALGCVAAAAVVCAAVQADKARQAGRQNLLAGPLLKAALAGGLGWAAGWAAVRVAVVEPRLAAVAHCCGAIVALGLCAGLVS